MVEGPSRVRALNGPFRYLRALWQFKELPDGGAEVTFNMNYEFKNPVIALTVGRFFDKAFRHLVDAFKNRADALLRSEKLRKSSASS